MFRIKLWSCKKMFLHWFDFYKPSKRGNLLYITLYILGVITRKYLSLFLFAEINVWSIVYKATVMLQPVYAGHANPSFFLWNVPRIVHHATLQASQISLRIVPIMTFPQHRKYKKRNRPKAARETGGSWRLPWNISNITALWYRDI